MSNQNDYIGKSIYVITKAEVRYEGTLIDVDREKKIMSLRNVSQKGTEGRRNGENEIPPNDTILGMVKFKVELIKEFNIISQPDDDEVDPAILEQQEIQNQQKNDDWSKGSKNVKTKEEQNDSENEKEEPPRTGYQAGPRQAENERESSQNEEEQKQKPQEKPKYQKNDFFDSLTNSTLEVRPQRGGRGGGGYRGGRGGYQNNDGDSGDRQSNYRGGRGRGGYNNWNNNNESGDGRTEQRGGYRGRGRANYHQAPNDTETFGDAGKEQMSWQRNDNQNNRNNYNTTGGGGNRGGGGNYRNNNRGGGGGYGDSRQNQYRNQKYSDKLQDPNDINYNEGKGMEHANVGGEQKQGDQQENRGFFDNQSRRGGNRGGNRGGGGHRNNARDDNKDAETFGEGMASNFQYEHSNYRGNNNNRGGNRGGGNRNNNRGGGDSRGENRGDNRGENRDNHNDSRQNDRKNDPYKKSYNESQKNFKQEKVTDDGHKGFFDVPKNKVQQKRNTNRFAGLEEQTKSINKTKAAEAAAQKGGSDQESEEEVKNNASENVENTPKV